MERSYSLTFDGYYLGLGGLPANTYLGRSFLSHGRGWTPAQFFCRGGTEVL